MKKVKLLVPTNVPHVSQIITGFFMLKAQGWELEIQTQFDQPGNPYCGLPVVFADYEGLRIAYDVWDGYQAPDAMEICLNGCDLYFRRSFDGVRNERLFPEQYRKMYPLGFNYHVTCKEDPTGDPKWKALLKPLLGKTPDAWFTPDKFEGKAQHKEGQPVKILFLTRLWDDQEPGFSKEELAERTYINTMRIEIIRALREKYGENFVGGLNDSELARQWAPDLILPAKFTERRKYLKLLHSSDICIGSMGLFESIGWKTGEYVAAAKAVVNEHLHFSVTGDFEEGKNYLAFGTAQECIDAVQQLVASPEGLYAMKQANELYYQRYLRPDVLVKNTLDLADKKLAVKNI